jgi:uncharacterized protein (TIGR03066 family)
MNALRLMVAAAVAVALTAGVRAEDKEEKKDNAKLLVGTWEVTKSFDKGPAVGATVEFTKDGKVMVKTKVEDKDVDREGTYTVDGDKLTLVMKDKESKTILSIKKISDTELVTENDDKKSVELKRKK